LSRREGLLDLDLDQRLALGTSLARHVGAAGGSMDVGAARQGDEGRVRSALFDLPDPHGHRRARPSASSGSSPHSGTSQLDDQALGPAVQK
jgi:hypothetical protein